MNNHQMRVTFNVPVMTPIVKKIILINVLIFIVQTIIQNRLSTYAIFGLTPKTVIDKYYFWQPFTYMFLHGNFTHLFFNLFTLWMFGTELESHWGPAYFLKYYILTGLGAGVFSFLSFETTIIGASGAIFGLLLAYGIYWPNKQVLLMFVIPIKIKWMLIIMGLLSLYSAGINSGDSIAHLTHLGGLIVGFIYLKYESILYSLGKRPRVNKNYFKNKLKNQTSSNKSTYNNDTNISNIESQVDIILDKIGKDGIEQLSFKEKQILKKASHLMNTKED